MFQIVAESWEDLMKHADPRVDGYLLMSSVWPTLIIIVLYVYVVKVAGPRWMQHRQPYECRRFMVVYNFAMVAMSAYMFYEVGMGGWFVDYSFSCQPVDYSYTPRALRMVNVAWVYYISKLIELNDTLFFVARRKFSHITDLHVFHHAIMPFSVWFGAKFTAGGFATFQGLVNTFVHFIMYTYYGISALGPQYQPYLWWKKYLTKLQITQLFLIVSHAAHLLFLPDCPVQRLCVYWTLIVTSIILLLFINFYRKAYRRSRQLDAVSRPSRSSKQHNMAAKNGYRHGNGVNNKPTKLQ